MNDGKTPSNAPPPGHFPLREGRRATDEPARAHRPTKPTAWDPNWLNRSGDKPAGRHSAITRNLYSWSSYKSWADKVKTNWDREK